MPTLEPLAFSSSEFWSRCNGNWSSFVVRIGTPEQDFRVLPSPSTGAVFVPDIAGCLRRDDRPYNCAELRGVVNSTYAMGFQPDSSRTWANEGVFEAHLGTEFGFNASARYGRDIVGLMVPHSGAPKPLANQTVGSLADLRPFFVGFFGLSPKPINFSNYDEPRPSYLTSLKNAQNIPSLSYGYTAGASYSELLKAGSGLEVTTIAQPVTFGSLTLGGYDENRREENNITFPFDPDDERSTSLFLQHISADRTSKGSVSLLTNPIYVKIDYTMPYLWLPFDACELFKAQFNLTWDSLNKLYLVEDDAHAALSASNPSFTFDLAKSTTSSFAETVRITLPYSAFNLQASWPTYNTTKNYFPIRRAANESQYTIGRAFMQEAYIIVDYERENFSIHQATNPAPTKQKLVGISSTDARDQHGKAGLSTASLVGITIGSIVLLMVVLIGAALYYRRKQRARIAGRKAIDEQSSSEDTEKKNELSTNVAREQLMSTEILELEEKKNELSADVVIEQLMSTDVFELDSIGRHNNNRAETKGDDDQELGG
jgi:hypothetical protein